MANEETDYTADLPSSLVSDLFEKKEGDLTPFELAFREHVKKAERRAGGPGDGSVFAGKAKLDTMLRKAVVSVQIKVKNKI